MVPSRYRSSSLPETVVHPASEAVDKRDHIPPCIDYRSVTVDHGMRYRPRGYDACTTCLCERGNASMCLSKMCSAPQGCLYPHPIDDKCCEFECLDGFGGSVPPSNVTAFGPNDTDLLNTTNFGLRLVASTLTSFLILALLLFMIHRLRQRRLLLMIRRINGGQLSGGPFGPRRYSIDDDGSVGYLTGRDQVDFAPYDEPPPPYTFWKPPESYFPQEEAPPPYDSAHFQLSVGIGTMAIDQHQDGGSGTEDNNNSSQRELLTATRTLLPVPTSFSPMTTIALNCPGQDVPVAPHGGHTPSLPNCNTSTPLQHVNITQVCLRAKDFQMNNLDREGDDSGQRHAVPFQDLNVVGSLSSLNSSQSELNELQSTTDDTLSGQAVLSSSVIIRSDAVYEDHQTAGLLPPLSPASHSSHSNLLHCSSPTDWGDFPSRIVPPAVPGGTYDIRRGRHEPGRTTEGHPSQRPPVPVAAEHYRVLQRVAFRCHSCSDVLECRRLQNDTSADLWCMCGATAAAAIKRRSLQPEASSVCPTTDPTRWMADGSETSSSSSPTYERTATLSPTSSDSSSVDYGFGERMDDGPIVGLGGPGVLSQGDHLKRRTRSDSQFADKQSSSVVRQCASLTAGVASAISVTPRPKSSSLERTLDSLKCKVLSKKAAKGPSRLRVILGGHSSTNAPVKESSETASSIGAIAVQKGDPRAAATCSSRLDTVASSTTRISSRTGTLPPVPPPRGDSLGPRSTTGTPGHRPTAIRRTPRISYVSDGDVSLRSLLCPSEVGGGSGTNRKEKVRQCVSSGHVLVGRPAPMGSSKSETRARPRSYDFADLDTVTGGATALGTGPVETAVTITEETTSCPAVNDISGAVGQSDRGSKSLTSTATPQLTDCCCSYSSGRLGSSWDSFTCTCSSRASFGSSTRSGSSPSREGPASPVESSCCSPARCSSAAAEPPSSPEEREFHPSSPTHKCSQRVHCLDVGTRGLASDSRTSSPADGSQGHFISRQENSAAEKMDDHPIDEARGHTNDSRMPTADPALPERDSRASPVQPPASTLAVANRIRVTIGSWKESHESYI